MRPELALEIYLLGLAAFFYRFGLCILFGDSTFCRLVGGLYSTSMNLRGSLLFFSFLVEDA